MVALWVSQNYSSTHLRSPYECGFDPVFLTGSSPSTFSCAVLFGIRSGTSHSDALRDPFPTRAGSVGSGDSSRSSAWGAGESEPVEGWIGSGSGRTNIRTVPFQVNSSWGPPLRSGDPGGEEVSYRS